MANLSKEVLAKRYADMRVGDNVVHSTHTKCWYFLKWKTPFISCIEHGLETKIVLTKHLMTLEECNRITTQAWERLQEAYYDLNKSP